MLSLELPSKLGGPRARIELGVEKWANWGVVLSLVAITQTNKTALEMRAERGEPPQSSSSTYQMFLFFRVIFPGFGDIYAKMLRCVVNTARAQFQSSKFSCSPLGSRTEHVCML